MSSFQHFGSSSLAVGLEEPLYVLYGYLVGSSNEQTGEVKSASDQVVADRGGRGFAVGRASVAGRRKDIARRSRNVEAYIVA